MLLLLTDILKYCSFLYLHHTLQPYVQTGMKRSDDDVYNDTSADTNDDDDDDDDHDDDDITPISTFAFLQLMIIKLSS